MTNGDYPTQALIRFNVSFASTNRPSATSIGWRSCLATFGPSQKCQKQAHPNPPISSANASPDNPVVRLYDQRNKLARLWYRSVQRNDRGIVPWDFSAHNWTRRNPVVDRQHGGRLRCARYAVLKI